MRAIGTAFLWSMILALLAGLLIGLGLDYIGYPWIVGPLFTAGLTVLDGWVKARGMLNRRLGYRDVPRLINDDRSVPVNFDFLLPGKQKTVDVQAETRIVCPSGDVIDQALIKRFVWRAWERQNRGKNGLGRRYWLVDARPTLTREQYDALIYALEQVGCLAGRKPGRTGRIIGSYDEVIARLRGE